MQLNTIKDNPAATKPRKRVGRGIGSGTGKTSARGMKGQKSRAGARIKGFEGGQMPLHMRFPKRGFNRPNAVKAQIVNLSDLQKALDAKKLKADKAIDNKALIDAGLIRSNLNVPVKLLAHGELKVGLKITVNQASESAAKAVEKAGGSLTIVEFKRTAPSKTEKQKAEKSPSAKAKKPAAKSDKAADK